MRYDSLILVISECTLTALRLCAAISTHVYFFAYFLAADGAASCRRLATPVGRTRRLDGRSKRSECELPLAVAVGCPNSEHPQIGTPDTYLYLAHLSNAFHVSTRYLNPLYFSRSFQRRHFCLLALMRTLPYPHTHRAPHLLACSFRDAASPTRINRRIEAKTMVLTGRLSLRKAAAEYNLSVSALGRLVHGEVSPSARVGRQTVLHPVVEKELARVCIFLYESNLSIHRGLIQYIAREIALKTGVPEDKFDASEKWFRGFKKRHPELASRKACKLNRGRAANFNRFAVQQWYAAVEDLIQLYDPTEIWNCDDTSKDPEMFSGMVRLHTRASIAAVVCIVYLNLLHAVCTAGDREEGRCTAERAPSGQERPHHRDAMWACRGRFYEVFVYLLRRRGQEGHV